MKLFVLVLVFGMFFISLVGATNIGTFKQGQQIQITNYCSTGDCTYANLTVIISPNGTIDYVNQIMTKNGQNFNYSYTPNVSGTYKFNTCSDPAGTEFCDSDSFTITPSDGGGILQKSIFVMFIIFLSSSFLFLSSKFDDNFLTLIFMFLSLILMILGLSTIKNLSLGSSVSFLLNAVYFLVLSIIVLVFFYMLIKNIMKFSKDVKNTQRAKEGLEPEF